MQIVVTFAALYLSLNGRQAVRLIRPFSRTGGRRSRLGANPFISALTVALRPAVFSEVQPQVRDILSRSPA